MWNTNTLWFEVAIVCGMTAFGSIFMGHFEEGASKLRRALKLVIVNAIVVLLSYYAGRVWAFGFLGLMFLAVLYIHII